MLLNVIEYYYIVLNTNIVYMIQKDIMPSARLNVTITPEAMQKANEYAKKQNRSLSNMVDTMIKQDEE